MLECRGAAASALSPKAGRGLPGRYRCVKALFRPSVKPGLWIARGLVVTQGGKQSTVFERGDDTGETIAYIIGHFKNPNGRRRHSRLRHVDI